MEVRDLSRWSPQMKRMLDKMYYDYIATIVDHRRPGNYRYLEEVCPDYVAKRLPTAFVHYIRNAINAPLDLLSFLLEAMRAQFR